MSKRPRKKGMMRRAYLKPFSSEMINGGRVLNAETMNEYKRRASRIGIDVTEPQYRGMTLPRGKVVKSLHALWQGKQEEYAVTLVDTPLRRVRMLFTGFSVRETYWFKWFDPIVETERVSITYGSKVIAMGHFTKGTITWK